MYLLIDTHRLCVVHRHANIEVVRNLCTIEFAHTSSFIIDEQDLAYATTWSLGHLIVLYENVTGHKAATTNRDILVKTIQTQCEAIETSKVDAYEIMLQALCIKGDDNGFYRYAPGKTVPLKLSELYLPPARVGRLQATPLQEPTQATQRTQAPLMGATAARATPTVPPGAPPKYPPPWA